MNGAPLEVLTFFRGAPHRACTPRSPPGLVDLRDDRIHRRAGDLLRRPQAQQQRQVARRSLPAVPAVVDVLAE